MIRRGKFASSGSSTSFLSDLKNGKEVASEKSECDNLLGRLGGAEAACCKGITPGLPKVLVRDLGSSRELLHQGPGWLQQGSIPMAPNPSQATDGT